MHSALARVALGVVLLTTGCRRCAEERAELPQKKSKKNESKNSTDDSDLAALMALGYTSHSPDKADKSKMGVVRHDPELAFPGYTLLTIFPDCKAILIDMQGKEVHSWQHPGCASWSHVELLPNGDLLVPGVERRRKGLRSRRHRERRFLLRVAATGELLWKRRLPVHHEAQLAQNGEILALTLGDRRVPYEPHRDITDNFIVRLSDLGARGDHLSLYGVLSNNDVGFEFKRVKPKSDHGSYRIDLIHANAVEELTSTALAAKNPLYRVGNLLVTIRHQDTVAIIDTARRLVWAWGQKVLSGPHDAQALANGNLLVFDNGLARGWSRIVEVDPSNKTIVWTYEAPRRKDFFTSGRGGCQRLPNGNTLIGESQTGRAFEVTRQKEIVWEYFVPVLDTKGHRATIVRARRYTAADVAAWRERP